MNSAERNKLLGGLLAGLARDAGMEVRDRSKPGVAVLWIEAEVPDSAASLSVMDFGDGVIKFGTCSCCTDPAYARCLDLWTSVLAVVNRGEVG